MALYAGETIGLKLKVESDAGIELPDGSFAPAPICPIPEEVKVQIYNADESVALTAELPLFLVNVEVGRASGGTPLTLVDAGKAWTPGQWKGAAMRITDGSGVGQERLILDNTATTLTIDASQPVGGSPVGPFSTVPDGTSSYIIHRGDYARNWDSPSNLADQVLVAVYRAYGTSSLPYLELEKSQFTLLFKPLDAMLISVDEVLDGISTQLPQTLITRLILRATRWLKGGLATGGIDPSTLTSLPDPMREMVILYTQGLIFQRDASSGGAAASNVKKRQEGTKQVTYAGDAMKLSEATIAQAQALLDKWIYRFGPDHKALFGTIDRDKPEVWDKANPPLPFSGIP